jgi:hypothetical protein
MARIKKYSPEQNLSSFQTFIIDDNPNSEYFRITEFKDTFTGGKNGFLIEGSEYLKESTEIKIELLDVAGNPIYYEPGNGIPEYYEGISKLIAVYIYNDTPIGLGKITILGELKQYDDNGVKRDVPEEWKGAYNVKWERTFQINKLLANEDKVRFYRRPQVTIDEIVKPIFSGNPPVVTQTGTVDGIPLVPNEGTDLSNFTLPTNYRLKVKTGNKWTGSIDEEIIRFDNIDYAPVIEEVVNENEIIVSPPYEENNIVKSFTNESYSLEFPYIENVADLATALTGSFAKISITDMKTFVGDAARVKVFRRSQSNLTDYEFVQEIQLESNEVLRDITTFAKKEEPYGFFTQPVIDEYWVTSSNDFNVTFNQDVLYNSAKLDSSPDNFFFTTESFSIQNGVEYTLDFNVRKGVNTSGDYLKVFLSGSNGSNSVSQTITTINSSNGILQKTNINENIIADTFDSARLYFEVSGSDWYVNNVSLKASQETSFSPDEITFVQQVPKFLVTETFDYRFEFYDINNNFIPVRVEDTKTFVGGNVNLFEKDIEITPDNLYFSFDSASNPANALPPKIINLEVLTELVTGSITYTSGAYDTLGNLLSSSQYIGGQYPGYLTNWDVNFGRQPFLRVEDFTGSRDDITVQFIRYTGAVEGVSDDFVISRVEDGKGGVSFEIVPFRGLQIKNKESKTLEIQAVRVDGINRINLRSGLERDFSDAKLHVLSSSLDGLTEVNTYVSLSQAITNPNFLEGVSAGETGSGEIDYNAIFTRDAIDNELTVYIMDGPTSESILTSEILTDLKDGLNPGLVSSTTEQFNIKYKPRELSQFDPLQSVVTASFQQRGTTLNPLTASLLVKPSSSIQPLTELPQYFMFYETGAFDDTIGIVVTDFNGNVIDNGVPGDTVPYYTAVQTKQLNLEFTYTEPITSASVTANKSYFITPDGLPGQDSITIDIDPNPIALGSNHKGDVYNYGLANTDIQVSQGDYFLINSASGNPGTFTTRSIVTDNIVYSTLDGDSTTTMSLAGFESMSALSASVRYDFDIYPYFTASLITASRTQKFTKVVEGGGAIEVTLDPIAVALNADEGGFVSDYTKAATEVFIKQNDEFFFYDEFDGGRPGTFVTASISASNIEFTELSSSFRDLSVSGSISSSGGEILHFKGFGGLDRNQPSASITYNFKVYPYSLDGGSAGVPRIVSKTQTYSKVNDGTTARKVSLVASSDTVVYDGDGVKVAPVGDISLTATAINVTGSAFFKFLNSDGSTLQASSTNNVVSTVPDLPNTGSTKTFTVELRDGNSAGTIVDTDSVTITGIGEGSTAYSVALSNPASSVTVEVDGTTYFDNAGTLIRAYKGGTELQYVEEYDESAVDPITFLPIGTFGQFSASIHEISSFLTQGTLRDGKEIVSKSISPTEDELFASSSAVSNWNTPESNTQGFITFKIDFENGRGTQFVQQSFSTVFEGATGPGLVVRGEWDETIAYIFDLTQKRRDAVFRDVSGTVHYWATTEELINKSEYTEESDGLGNDDGVYTGQPTVPVSPNGVGYIDPTTGWQYLGEQDFFVAAKMAIFEESFVKNTINVGEPATSYAVNPQIAIVGGTDEPYISIGQGTQGYGQQGAYIGVTEDGGPSNSVGGLLSLSGDPNPLTNGGSFNALKWDGETLLIRGAIRQTDAGDFEPNLRGTWQDSTQYYVNDSVIYNNQSFSSNANHISTGSDATNGEPGVGTVWDASSGVGKTVTLGATSFVIAYDTAGNTPSPSSIELVASSSNFVDPFFKFTGDGFSQVAESAETSYTNGADDDNDTFSITIPSSYFSTPLQFRVGVSDNDQNEIVSDVINVFAVKDGASSFAVINTNQAHTLPADSAGNVSSFADSGTKIEVYEGATKLLYDGSIPPSDGEFSIGNVVDTGITVNASPTAGSDYIEYGNHSNMTADSATIRYGITGSSADGVEFRIDTFQTLTKAKAGTDGVDGSSGVDGDAAGIVYAGNWEDGTISEPKVYLSGDLKYVVKYNATYYTCEDTHRLVGTYSDSAVYNNDVAVDDIFNKRYISTQATTAEGDWNSSTGYSQYSVVNYQGTAYINKSGFVSPGGGTPQAGAPWTNHSLTDTDLFTDLGANGARPGSSPSGGYNLWNSFGAQFTSVATDILFAEDVYANKTINIGTDTGNNPVIALNADSASGYANPYISIGQLAVSQSFEEDGIFMGFDDGSPVLSLVSGSSYMIYDDGVIALSDAAFQGTGSSIIGPSLQIGRNNAFTITSPKAYNFSVSSNGIMSASEAYIEGTINASAGTIGQWIITEQNDDGSVPINDVGVLQDSDGELRFNPNTAEIQIYSASVASETSILNPPDSGSVFQPEATASVTVVSGQFYLNTFDGNGSVSAPDLFLKRSIYLEQKIQGAPALKMQGGYYFDMSDTSNSGHKLNFTFDAADAASRTPFFESQTTTLTTSTGQQFLVQSSSADPGSAGAYIQLTLSSSVTESNTMYYYCENHPTTMGGQATLFDNTDNTTQQVLAYTERVTIGAQNEFTDTAGANSQFDWTGSAAPGEIDLDDFSFFNSASAAGGFANYPPAIYYDDYSTPSPQITLPAGTVTLTGIEAPSAHVNSTSIPNADFDSAEPNYNASYENQIHGTMGLSTFPSRGYRRISLYLEIVDNSDGSVLASRYLSNRTAYGSQDEFGYWQAIDMGGQFSTIGSTEITLEDGTTKLAKDITLDDKILSWDSEKEKWVSAQLSEISKRNVNEVYKVSVDGKEVEVSDNHRFWLSGNQENSAAICVSTLYDCYKNGSPMTQNNLRLWVKDGDSKKKCIIDKVEKIHRDDEVVTLSVPKYVNYLSNDIVSHNYQSSNYIWEFQTIFNAQTATGATYAPAVNNYSTDVTIPAGGGNYVARYRVRLETKATMSVTVSSNSSATSTISYDNFNNVWNYDLSTANFYLNGGFPGTSYGSNDPFGYFNQTISVQQENNFIEIIPAGIQVVSNTGRYVRIARKEINESGDGLLEVSDGSIEIDSEGNVGSLATTGRTAISARGDIIPKDSADTDYSTSGDGGWDLGSTVKYWNNLYTRQLNGTPIGSTQLVAACYFYLNTSGTIQGPYSAFNVSGVSKSGVGMFTVSLTHSDGFSLSGALGFASGYGRNNSSHAGPGTNLGDGEFSFNVGVKVKSTNVEINTKDNNGDTNRDPSHVYFVLFAQ